MQQVGKSRHQLFKSWGLELQRRDNRRTLLSAAPKMQADCLVNLDCQFFSASLDSLFF